MGKRIGESCIMVMLWLKSGVEKYRVKMVALLLCDCWQERLLQIIIKTVFSIKT